jgi:hypothetical protein
LFSKNTFLPAAYRKDDKKNSFSQTIINQHKKFANMKEQQAKSRYVMKVRQLKTFGITFFECKQRIPGKKDPGMMALNVWLFCLISFILHFFAC